MSKGLTIIDKDYTQWVENLSVRYRQSQIKAAVRVNRELLKYYWELGRDIEEMHVEERWDRVSLRISLWIYNSRIRIQRGFLVLTSIMQKNSICFILNT